MERQGGEPWLGRIVKQLLESAVAEPARPPAKQVGVDPTVVSPAAI